MNEREIFAAAIKLNSDQRIAFLDAACGQNESLRQQVDELLSAHDDSKGPVPLTSDREIEAAQAEKVHAEAGTVIGPYKLLEEIGEGGMGSVWVAEQFKPIRRKVAIKLIKLGMDSKSVLARFDAERQALALMDHPNIARVLDGGVTDEGRPYFAMEYVKGVPLIEYCDNARLSITERLELFVPICKAVQHAHQKGVIHRDLKPSNILVCLYDGKPVPKVIDFGLVKAMHHSLTERTLYTAHGMMVGTPLYMSPEQAESNNLDVDTRTDIYSLGVILYELLTGSTPLEKAQLKDAAINEILRLIKEVEPPKPSTRISSSQPNVAAQRRIEPGQLARSVSGDLDWVVMKALEKERSRRYETADGLAEDIRRHLLDEPVSAGPPSATYKFAKLVKRNKGLFTAAAAVFVALTLGLIGTSWGLLSAARARSKLLTTNAQLDIALKETEQQRSFAQENELTAVAEAKRAERELARAKEVRQLIDNMFSSITPEQARGEDITLIETILDDAALRLSSGQIEDDVVAADMHGLIGFVYSTLGMPREAEHHSKSAIDLNTPILGRDHFDVRSDVHAYACAIGDQGRYKEEERLLRPLLTNLEDAETAKEKRLWFAVMNDLGANLSNQRRFEEAEDMLRRALELQRDEYGDGSIFVLPPMGNLVNVYLGLDDLKQAEAMCRQAMDVVDSLPVDAYNASDYTTPPGWVKEVLTSQLGYIHMSQGRLDEAEPFFDEVLAIRRKKYGERHPVTQLTMAHLAGLYRQMERYDEARALFEKTLILNRRHLGLSVPQTREAMWGLAHTYRELDMLDEAVNLETELVGLLTGDPPTMKLPTGHLNKYAWMLVRPRPETIRKVSAELALKLAQRSCALAIAQGGADLASARVTRARVHVALGEWENAIAGYDRAVAEKPELLQEICEYRGRAYAALGQWNKAADDLLIALNNDSSHQEIWLQLMPVLVLADRVETYRRCIMMGSILVAGTKDPREAELACKLGLLIPDVTDPNNLPIDVISRVLQDGAAPRDLEPGFWACKALVAYRSGEFDSAIDFVARSQQLDPHERLRPLNLAIQALSEYGLNRQDDARDDLRKANQLIDLLQQEPINQGHHDVLIAQILLSEAESKINENPKP